MKAYIGAKIIKAEPMTKELFENKFQDGPTNKEDSKLEGYHVEYSNPDGSRYHLWSPKNVFETAYRLIENHEAKLITE